MMAAMDDQNALVELHQWTATLTDSVMRVAIQILEFLPFVLGAVVLLLVGWGVARLLGYATEKITEKTIARLARTRPMDTRVKQPQSYSAAPTVISRVVFWLVMLFFILAAAEVLELEMISGVLSAITAYLPRLLAGLVILFIGLWLAEAVRALVTRTGLHAGIRQSEVLGRLGQALVLLVVFSIAAGQVGIDNTILVALVATLFGVLLGAIALAFAFGARTTIANMLAAQTVAQTYYPGDIVRIGAVEGKILRITRTSLILETAEGQALVPAKHFSEQESVNISGPRST